jgi:hypothetical protein
MSRRELLSAFFLLATQVFVGMPISAEPLLPLALVAQQAYVGVPLRCKTALD